MARFPSTGNDSGQDAGFAAAYVLRIPIQFLSLIIEKMVIWTPKMGIAIDRSVSKNRIE